MTDVAREVRWALVNARQLCHGLGLLDGSKNQPGGGLLIRCPSHRDRDPSCGVTAGPDGTLRARCFACQWSADALGMIATVRGLNVRDADQFRQVLAEGAQIAGLFDLEAEILDGKPRPERRHVEPPPPEPERDYPPADEVTALWDTGTRVDEDRDASRYLVGRLLDPSRVAELNLARVVVGSLPAWAKYRGQSWIETGHRMVTRAFDATGDVRSVRAFRITDGDSPKRLPPGGHKAAGLVLLNRPAMLMVKGRVRPERVVVVEGEPDFLTRSTLSPEPCIGIGSGAWTEELARRIPTGCEVIVRTHNDDAGDRYADRVVDSLAGRCKLWRKVA